MDKGMRAERPRWRYQKRKRTVRRGEMMKRDIMVGEDQAWTVPPHWMARRRVITAGAKRAKPGRSRDERVARGVDLGVMVMVGWVRWGIRVRRRRTVVRAPAGRLM